MNDVCLVESSDSSSLSLFRASVSTLRCDLNPGRPGCNQDQERLGELEKLGNVTLRTCETLRTTSLTGCPPWQDET